MFSLSRINQFGSDDFDGLFSRAWVWPSGFPVRSERPIPEFEAYTSEDQLIYRFSVPGVDPSDVEVSTVNNQLVIRVERKQPENLKAEDWHVRGFPYGKFEQLVRLPNGTVPESVKATFKHGILEVAVPLSKARLAKKIDVNQEELVSN